MPTIALKAHYDGERIVLDEPFQLPMDASLIVTLLPDSDAEREEWAALAAANLARAYGPGEPEYTLDDIKARP